MRPSPPDESEDKRPKRFYLSDFLIVVPIGAVGGWYGYDKLLTILMGILALLASIGLRHLWHVWRKRGANPPQP